MAQHEMAQYLFQEAKIVTSGRSYAICITAPHLSTLFPALLLKAGVRLNQMENAKFLKHIKSVWIVFCVVVNDEQLKWHHERLMLKINRKETRCLFAGYVFVFSGGFSPVAYEFYRNWDFRTRGITFLDELYLLKKAVPMSSRPYCCGFCVFGLKDGDYLNIWISRIVRYMLEVIRNARVVTAWTPIL